MDPLNKYLLPKRKPQAETEKHWDPTALAFRGAFSSLLSASSGAVHRAPRTGGSVGRAPDIVPSATGLSPKGRGAPVAPSTRPFPCTERKRRSGVSAERRKREPEPEDAGRQPAISRRARLAVCSRVCVSSQGRARAADLASHPLHSPGGPGGKRLRGAWALPGGLAVQARGCICPSAALLLQGLWQGCWPEHRLPCAEGNQTAAPPPRPALPSSSQKAGPWGGGRKTAERIRQRKTTINQQHVCNQEGPLLRAGLNKL